LKSRVYARLREQLWAKEGYDIFGTEKGPEGMERNLLYEQKNLKEQARLAVEMLINDKVKAFNIAMGYVEDSNILSTTMAIALGEQALSEGNNALYGRIWRNTSMRLTREGQDIVAAKGAISMNSTAKYLQDLIAAKTELVGKRFLGGDLDKVQKHSLKARALEMVDRGVVKAQKEINFAELQKYLDKITC